MNQNTEAKVKKKITVGCGMDMRWGVWVDGVRVEACSRKYEALEYAQALRQEARTALALAGKAKV